MTAGASYSLTTYITYASQVARSLTIARDDRNFIYSLKCMTVQKLPLIKLQRKHRTYTLSALYLNITLMHQHNLLTQA